MLGIPHNQPSLGREEEEACARVLQSGWVASGPEVKKFEEEFAAYLGLAGENCIAVSSGSAALYLALLALGAHGKKVSSSVYVCAALRNAIAMAQAAPHYLDCQANSPQISSQFESGEVAILPHMFGWSSPLSNFNSKAFIIEDVAQSLGASWQGKKLGTLGRLGIFSFYASKLMTSGGHGGMVVSSDASLIEALRDYREFDGRDDQKLRFNFQMTDLQAAVGRVQLQKLPGFIERRAEIFSQYQEAGLNLLGGSLPKEVSPVRYRAILRPKNPKALQKELAEYGIRSIVPIEDWEIQSRDEAKFPNAYSLSRSTLSLPIYPNLKSEQVSQIISKLLPSKHL